MMTSYGSYTDKKFIIAQITFPRIKRTREFKGINEHDKIVIFMLVLGHLPPRIMNLLKRGTHLKQES